MTDKKNMPGEDDDTVFVYHTQKGEMDVVGAFADEEELTPHGGWASKDFDPADFGYDTDDLNDVDYDDDVEFDDSEFGEADFGEDFGEDYTEEQWEEIEKVFGLERRDHLEESLCTVSIVGRPNVGKSTLVNRFIGRREAVVEDLPGVTRDRVSYLADWGGQRFWVQDTGGWDPNVKGIHASIAHQAEIAMAASDVIVFVVDTKVGVTETDAIMADKLKRADVPVILVSNKFDSDTQWADMAEFYSLGLGDPYAVSAQHGRGGADVLDKILASFPEEPRKKSIVEGPRRVALVGKPNVGKSSLINKFAGEERSVVDNVPGTTWEQQLTPEQIIELAHTRSYWLRSNEKTRAKVDTNLSWYLFDHLGFKAGIPVNLPYRCDGFLLTH